MTVREATLALMRELRLTTIFGKPGSTEESFLSNLPEDFSYVLGLQEASVLAMADVTRKPPRHRSLPICTPRLD